MWEVVQENPFVVGALSGSLAAYVLSLIVSYLRREKRWLGYQISYRNIVESGPSKLEVMYDGRKIERLDSQSVQLRNIGNRPLCDQRVQISCKRGEIVECELDLPDGARAPVHAPAAQLRIVEFDLLNPGEALNIGVTVVDGLDEPVSVVARGEFLEVRAIGDRAATDELMEIFLSAVPFWGVFFLDLLKLSRRLFKR